MDAGCGPTHGLSSHAEVASHIEKLEGHTTRIYNYVLGLSEKIKIIKKIKLECDVHHRQAAKRLQR